MVKLENLNVAVIGLGLLGGSLALALRGRVKTVFTWARRDETRDFARRHGMGDVVCETSREALSHADVAVLCLPIPAIVDFLKNHADEFAPGSVATDIGSVKRVIVSAGEAGLAARGVSFVGSHPMAGTEKSGADAAFAELYDHAEVFVTPTPESDPAAVETVTALWEALGTRVNPISPGSHDVLVAHTSHISHLLALGITLSVLGEKNPELRRLRFSGCATGFRDTSRIASSSPAMWRQIVEANSDAIMLAIAEYEWKFAEIKRLIAVGDFDGFEKLFAEGKALRDSWIEYKNREQNCNW
ncbi:MAG: prephenate dehydrogenase [Victivallaceae bacterium]|nr:prephenate dehydrogenase/arogenate dehydrogenase family protein [Victivallaceae bacterium]